jgi:predicted nucleic acid-binding protein
MILLDTTVISELMRAEPAQAVLDWFGQHDAADLFIAAVTEAELRAGIADHRRAVGPHRAHDRQLHPVVPTPAALNT